MPDHATGPGRDYTILAQCDIQSDAEPNARVNCCLVKPCGVTRQCSPRET
jgi:hypothetical protein